MQHGNFNSPEYGQQGWAAPAPTQDSVQQIVTAAYATVFWWMGIGLGLTGVVAFGVSAVAGPESVLFTPPVYYGLMIAELGLVWYLSARIHTLSSTVATGLFLFYAALSGVTLSVIFLVYTAGSIASTFFITAGMFGAMAFVGHVTKRDLSSMGSFLFMGLIGIIIASVVNMFMQSPILYWGVSFLGVFIFLGLTIYDVNKIKNMALSGAVPLEKLAIYGALMLYLDFINLFLMLLRFFGRRD